MKPELICECFVCRARMWASLAAAFAAVAIADADFGREDAAAASMRKAASYAHLAQREGWRPEFDFEAAA